MAVISGQTVNWRDSAGPGSWRLQALQPRHVRDIMTEAGGKSRMDGQNGGHNQLLALDGGGIRGVLTLGKAVQREHLGNFLD